MSKAKRPLLLLATVLIVFTACVLYCCHNGDDLESGLNSAGKANQKFTANIRMAVGLKVRKQGELEFKLWNENEPLPRGATIRSELGTVTIDFMNSVKISLSINSELILEGAINCDKGKELVLGLKKGEVLIHSSAGCPLVVKMPHGEVRGGTDAYFRIKDLHRSKLGYGAMVESICTRALTVANRKGVVQTKNFCKVRLNETEPPKIIPQRR